MLFKLILNGTPEELKGETLLGYEWIEVLQVLPWWIKEVVGDKGEKRGSRIEHQYLCRTEYGITWLSGADLDPEIESGVYIEEGRPPPPVVSRCHICDDVGDCHACRECGRFACKDHATEAPDGLLCNECAGL